MANELENLNLNELTLDQVKKLKNQAMERLKSAGQAAMQQSHQNHTSHADHATGPKPLQP